MFLQTDFSLFSSTLSAKKGVALIKEAGYSEVVLSDTNLSGLLNFYYAAKKVDIKPIIALRKEYLGVEYLFISKNVIGYSVLTRMDSLGIDKSIFKDINIIAVAIDIISSEDIDIFSDYVSLKREIVKKDKNINQKLIESQKEILPISIFNIENNRDFYTLGAMKAVNSKKSYEFEIAQGNVQYNKIITKEEFLLKDNSSKVLQLLDTCEDNYSFGNPVPPLFKFTKEVSIEYGLEGNTLDKTLFEAVTWKGLEKKFKGEEIPKEYKDRLEFEMNVINNMNFAGYFLIVWDFIAFSKQENIPVGPGRGSAAGSLVAYSLEITDIDPIPNGLLFERFLNPERVNLPDIDIDFCQKRRGEVISYVSNKYGKECVAQVITFGTLAARASIRDAARVVQAPLYLADKMAKMVEEKPGITLKEDYSNKKKEWDSILTDDPKDFIAKKIWDKALKMEGLKKNTGVHAAGLVISNDPIYNRSPIYEVNETQVVGLEGYFLEDVNLVKYDFLGLKTLTIIDNSISEIKKQLGIELSTIGVKPIKKEVFDYIAKGDTLGLFQIEGGGMQSLSKRLSPCNFEELTAMLALYRPGPMEAGMLDSFINRKHKREKVDYFFESMENDLKPILEPTYGLIVYQEQVMQIVQKIAGFTLGEADLVRRAMGKKKKEEMVRLSKEFVIKAKEKGHNPEEAKKLFDLIEKFAGYGFNKSHSAAYALITYITADLKLNYPTIFLSSLINSDITNTDKLISYMGECKRLNIKISTPNAKECTIEFTPNEEKREIIFGLKAVKGVGNGAEIILKAINKVGKEASLLELLSYSQRDIKKEIEHTQKLINANNRKILSNNKKRDISLKAIDKLDKFLNENKSLTKAQSNKLDKFNETIKSIKLIKESGTKLSKKQLDTLRSAMENKKELLNTLKDKNSFSVRQENSYEKHSKLIEELNNQLKDIEIDLLKNQDNLKLLNKELNDTQEHDKLDKRVLEALAEVGAMESFGITRKDLIDNINLFLKPKEHNKIILTNKEITIKEKIEFEENRTGLVISNIFTNEEIKEIELYDIPNDIPIGKIISKEINYKKNGEQYLKVKFINQLGVITEGSDFNNVCEDKDIGELNSFHLSFSGEYININKAIKFSTKKAKMAYSLKIDPDIQKLKEKSIDIKENLNPINTKENMVKPTEVTNEIPKVTEQPNKNSNRIDSKIKVKDSKGKVIVTFSRTVIM